MWSPLKNILLKQIFFIFQIIIYILEFLPLSDRISASQVCHLWHNASKYHKLHSNEGVVLCGDLTRPLQVFENSLGTFLHFVFKNVKLGRKLTKFWNRFCPQMQSLSIEDCDISEKTIVRILLKCSHLETLDVSRCYKLLKSGRVLEQKSDVILLSNTLVKLRKLRLDSNWNLSDALFNRFMAIASNLEDLSLTRCHISFDLELCKEYYPGDMLESGYTMASESVLTFVNILKHIESKAKLSFGVTGIDDAALSQLAEVPELHLETLDLNFCKELNNEGILRLTEYQQSLTKLDLSNCRVIGDPSLIAICHNLKNLLMLSIGECYPITNTGISELCHLKKLVNLNLSMCRQVSGEGIERGLCSSVNLQFQRLNLARLPLCERTLCRIAENLPRLTYLDLGSCSNAVTDMSVQAIFQHQVWLRSLKLRLCRKVTDAGLTGMGLRTRGEEVENGFSIIRLKGLQELDLYGCKRITDVSLKYAFSFLKLRRLNLSFCWQVSFIREFNMFCF
ncbi:F-box/LRR-repeat protein 2-like isoform X2 [Zootermopsis nevadensis]|uniref:F-box/LRR-repeat protein 2-like isoform X2 n=1 Tax=Zootermopsis nevadensis TaxID=136037 RepID=UPI000B8E55D7|nr:F-box/LRR-repeat protein 2-like isoform X2 [Zootermopsis nevadensis]